jgi:hypothetical protein
MAKQTDSGSRVRLERSRAEEDVVSPRESSSSKRLRFFPRRIVCVNTNAAKTAAKDTLQFRTQRGRELFVEIGAVQTGRINGAGWRDFGSD